MQTFYHDQYHTITILFALMGLCTVCATIFDPYILRQFKIIIVVAGGLFFLGTVVGLSIEHLINISIYCVIFGGVEIFSGVAKVNEALGMIFKEKNKLGWAFLCDAIIEIVLGTLMIIEREAELKVHLNLIAIDKIYECSIKILNGHFLTKKEKTAE